MRERILPRAARERWIEPPSPPGPQRPPPGLEDLDFEGVFEVEVQPVGRSRGYMPQRARMVRSGSEHLVVDPVSWQVRVEDTIHRCRIWEPGTGQLLAEFELMSHQPVRPGDTIEFDVNDLKVTMA